MIPVGSSAWRADGRSSGAAGASGRLRTGRFDSPSDGLRDLGEATPHGVAQRYYSKESLARAGLSNCGQLMSFSAAAPRRRQRPSKTRDFFEKPWKPTKESGRHLAGSAENILRVVRPPGLQPGGWRFDPARLHLTSIRRSPYDISFLRRISVQVCSYSWRAVELPLEFAGFAHSRAPGSIPVLPSCPSRYAMFVIFRPRPVLRHGRI